MSEQNGTSENELHLLEALDGTPETTQADLAAQVGVAVGTVNWYLKRWSNKGFVKVKRIGRWNWNYLLTPEGLAHKSSLATKYVDASMSLYRRTRADAQKLLAKVKAAGFEQVYVDGNGEIAEICHLTCLEMHVQRLSQADCDQPQIVVDGTKLALVWPNEENDGD